VVSTIVAVPLLLIDETGSPRRLPDPIDDPKQDRLTQSSLNDCDRSR